MLTPVNAIEQMVAMDQESRPHPPLGTQAHKHHVEAEDLHVLGLSREHEADVLQGVGELLPARSVSCLTRAYSGKSASGSLGSGSLTSGSSGSSSSGGGSLPMM